MQYVEIDRLVDQVDNVDRIELPSDVEVGSRLEPIREIRKETNSDETSEALQTPPVNSSHIRFIRESRTPHVQSSAVSEALQVQSAVESSFAGLKKSSLQIFVESETTLSQSLTDAESLPAQNVVQVVSQQLGISDFVPDPGVSGFVSDPGGPEDIKQRCH
jgi:hypothetical protein